jgi:hypothetical protein
VSHRQADQLAVAIRSPIAAQEDQHRRGVEVIGKPPRPSFLVGERETGQHQLTIAKAPRNRIGKGSDITHCRRTDARLTRDVVVFQRLDFASDPSLSPSAVNGNTE